MWGGKGVVVGMWKASGGAFEGRGGYEEVG